MRAAPPALARELLVVVRHFFPEFSDWLGQVPDPRNPLYLVYPLKVLLLLGVLIFLSHSASRNHFNDNLRDARQLARTLAAMLGCAVEALPHLDTLEKLLRRLSPRALETLPARMIRRLIRMKALDDWRVGSRFTLAIDGTGLYAFRERHCEQCIETHHESGAVTYGHKVLVAFLISPDGYALPIACEFIENPGPVYKKQDCEIKAFHRLEAKLRGLFPQTSFWLLLDSLYADQNVMRPVIENGGNFSITFLDTDMPALWREAQSLRALSPNQRLSVHRPKDQGTLEVSWINDLDYEGMSLSGIFQVETDTDGNILQRFAHLCARPIDRDNALQVATIARRRSGCENEGFNVLKNGGFALEHVYSRKPVAAKGYFHLMLVAHLLQQLLTRGRLGAVFKEAFHTFRNYGKRLLEALRTEVLPDTIAMPGQIRLSTA